MTRFVPAGTRFVTPYRVKGAPSWFSSPNHMKIDDPSGNPPRHLLPAIRRPPCARFLESFFAERHPLRAHPKGGASRAPASAKACSTSTPPCSTFVAPSTSSIPNIHAGCSTVAPVAPPCASGRAGGNCPPGGGLEALFAATRILFALVWHASGALNQSKKKSRLSPS